MCNKVCYLSKFGLMYRQMYTTVFQYAKSSKKEPLITTKIMLTFTSLWVSPCEVTETWLVSLTMRSRETHMTSLWVSAHCEVTETWLVSLTMRSRETHMTSLWVSPCEVTETWLVSLTMRSRETHMTSLWASHHEVIGTFAMTSLFPCIPKTIC